MVCRSAVCASDPVRVPQSPVEEGQLAQLGAAKVVLLKKKKEDGYDFPIPVHAEFFLEVKLWLCVGKGGKVFG